MLCKQMFTVDEKQKKLLGRLIYSFKPLILYIHISSIIK